MQIYLPIAELSLNVFLLLGLGGLIGFLAGLFGVGGGFMMTPLLIFIGVPPAVAVATQANHVVASSVSGVMAHFKRGNVDVKMGLVLLAGGFLGSTVGVALFSLLRGLGQIDLVISLSYVILLAVIGVLLMLEGGRALLRRRRKLATPRPQGPCLGRRLAAAHALSQVAALHLGAAAALARVRRRRALGDHGRGRRLHPGAADDLRAGHADRGGDRHQPVPDHPSSRPTSPSCRRPRTRPSTWCWRCCWCWAAWSVPSSAAASPGGCRPTPCASCWGC